MKHTGVTKIHKLPPFRLDLLEDVIIPEGGPQKQQACDFKYFHRLWYLIPAKIRIIDVS